MSYPTEIQFFLGSNTKRGFVPLFEQYRDPIKNYRMYILKGGPGSGKSSLMRRIAKTMVEHGHNIEYVPCSSDPKSLDAIFDYDAKTAIVDGTAPHTLDPKYPGAYDIIINLGDAWNQNSLFQHRQRIIELNSLIANCHAMATSCIAFAAELLDTNKSIAKIYVNHSAVKTYVQKLMDELKDSAAGKERKRLLSAVSVGKIEFFDDTMKTLCPKLYVIPDEWGAASDSLLSSLHDTALLHNLDVITCYCSIQNLDKIDHLLFPSAGIGVTTSNSFHATSCENGIIVEGLMNPVDASETDTMINHLSTAQHLIETACEHVERAKRLHDELETFYIGAMDFSKVDVMYERIINDMLHKE